jgi:YD repeat-containing protein
MIALYFPDPVFVHKHRIACRQQGEVVENAVCTKPTLPLIANAGPDRVIQENSAQEVFGVKLDGTGSTDPDGDTLSYSWTQTGGPQTIFDNQSSATPSLTVPGLPLVEFNDDGHNEILTFQLTVDDGHNSTATSQVHLTLIPHHCQQGETVVSDECRLPDTTLPVADTGPEPVIDETRTNPENNIAIIDQTPDRVMLDGTASSDPDGDTLSYSWTQTRGAPVMLDDPHSPTPSFSAPVLQPVNPTDNTQNELLEFVLTVDDGHNNTDTNTVDVTIIPHQCHEGSGPVIANGVMQCQQFVG